MQYFHRIMPAIHSNKYNRLCLHTSFILQYNKSGYTLPSRLMNFTSKTINDFNPYHEHWSQ